MNAQGSERRPGQWVITEVRMFKGFWRGAGAVGKSGGLAMSQWRDDQED